MAKFRINDEEREMWVNNYEYLYNLWRRSGRGIVVWVRSNRELIDEVIRGELSKEPSQ